jgi:hypothetical protein
LAVFLGTKSARAQSEPVQVLRIHFTNQTQLDRLAATADVWEVVHEAGYAIVGATHEEERRLARLGYGVSLDAERTRQARMLTTPGAFGGDASAAGIIGFPCYRTVDETYTDLATLANNHPTLARWEDMGNSWLKTQDPAAGDDLRVLVLSNQQSAAPKAVFWLLAAVHARELTTAELAVRFAESMVARYGRDPDVTWLLDHTEIHIVPYGNPDGRREAEKLILWRKTVADGDGCFVNNPPWSYAGVDLNRNGSYGWQGCGTGNCSSSQPCEQTYRGPAAASEPETQALEAYARRIFSDQRGPAADDAAPADATGLFISLHSYSELVLFPWGWLAEPTPNAAELQTLGRKFGYFNDYAVCQVSQPGCLYRADGTNDDFVYGELGVAAFTFELGEFFFESCSAFEETILPDNLPALVYAAKAARRPYAAPAGPEVTQLTTVPMPVAPGSRLTVTATLDDTRYASNGFGEEPVQAIGDLRYSLDGPSWLAAPTTLSPDEEEPAATVVTRTFTLETAGLAVGRHQLWVEGQDSAGNWGVPSTLFIDISEDKRALTVQHPSTLVAAVDTRRSFTLTVTNTGQIRDEYTVKVTDSPWPVQVSSTTLSLEPGMDGQVQVEVSIPRAAVRELNSTIRLAVASTVEPWVEQPVPVLIDLANQRLYLPIAGR